MTCDNLFSKKQRICQYDEAEISCGVGEVMTILEASFGRWDGGNTICKNPPIATLNVEDCGDPNNSQTMLKSQCDGKNKCLIDASEEVYGTQKCPETFKYMEARYECVAK